MSATKLAELAGVLIHDGTFSESPEVVSLVEAFAANHPRAAALAAAWDARPPEVPIAEWLRAQTADLAFKGAATDLSLTALFGAVFVDEKAMDAKPNRPEWAFVGRFWRVVNAHAPALSMGPFGHWAYPPGPRWQ